MMVLTRYRSTYSDQSDSTFSCTGWHSCRKREHISSRRRTDRRWAGWRQSPRTVMTPLTIGITPAGVRLGDGVGSAEVYLHFLIRGEPGTYPQSHQKNQIGPPTDSWASF